MREIKGFNSLPQNEIVEFENLEKGAYICQIKSVEDVEEKEYLKIKFDIVDGKYKGWFSEMAGDDLDSWSNQGTTYRSYKENAARFFKAFITAIEKSNAKSNYRWNWDEKTGDFGTVVNNAANNIATATIGELVEKGVVSATVTEANGLYYYPLQELIQDLATGDFVAIQNKINGYTPAP